MMRDHYQTKDDAHTDGWIEMCQPIEQYRKWLIIGFDPYGSGYVNGRSRSGHGPRGLDFDWVRSDRRISAHELWIGDAINRLGRPGAYSRFIRRNDWDAATENVRQKIEIFLDGMPNVDDRVE